MTGAESETDLQECKDKEATMTEDVRRMLSGGQLALVENMDHVSSSVGTTAAAPLLLLQIFLVQKCSFSSVVATVAARRASVPVQRSAVHRYHNNKEAERSQWMWHFIPFHNELVLGLRRNDVEPVLLLLFCLACLLANPQLASRADIGMLWRGSGARPFPAHCTFCLLRTLRATQGKDGTVSEDA